tara:strand:- start:115 stop:402 length:288 start_codon:yes stop_codon:yes gene_type:complete
MKAKLSIEEIQTELEKINGWSFESPQQFITKKFRFNNWLEVMAFLNKITDAAEELNHHPNINFTYGFCEVKIQTHDIKSISKLDFKLALKIDNCL